MMSLERQNKVGIGVRCGSIRFHELFRATTFGGSQEPVFTVLVAERRYRTRALCRIANRVMRSRVDEQARYQNRPGSATGYKNESELFDSWLGTDRELRRALKA
jgi:hypothetical protein